MDTLKSYCEPVPNGPGTEGHGEGLKYSDKVYYYHVGKLIPKDKVVALKWEGNWCGRQHGEKHYIVVGWNGDSFTLIEVSYSGSVKKAVAEYKGMTVKEAIKRAEEKEQELKDWIDSHPKCRSCGKPVIVIGDKQPRNQCLACFNAGK